MIFSCKKCEEEVNENEREILGITDEEWNKIKNKMRMKGVVIDGTASGIVISVPELRNTTATLRSSKNKSKIRLITNRKIRLTIEKFIDLLKSE